MATRTLTVVLAGDSKGITRALNQGSSGFAKFTKAAGIAGVAGVAAMTGIATKGVAGAVKLEKGLAEVRTLLPELSDQGFGKLRKEVLAFSNDMGVATDKAVPALYQAISAGVPPDNVITFMETASKAAIGGVTNLETAVDGITSVVNAYGKDMIGAAKASDLMFTAVRLGKTTFDELATSLFNVVPIAAASGVEFDEVTAALAALTKQGVPTSVATTQLRAAIQSLTAPTVRQRKMMEELGLEFSAARLEQIGLSGAFKEAIEATGGNMEQLRRLIGSVEGLQAVLALGGDQAHVFDEILREMQGSAGATDAAFDTMADTSAFKLEKALTQLNNLLTEIGAELLPVVTDVLEHKVMPALQDATRWFSENRDRIGDAAKALSGFMETFVSGASWIITKKPLLIAAISAVGIATVTALGPAGAAFAAILGLTTLLGKLLDTWEEAQQDLKEHRAELDRATRAQRYFDDATQNANVTLNESTRYMSEYDRQLQAVLWPIKNVNDMNEALNESVALQEGMLPLLRGWSQEINAAAIFTSGYAEQVRGATAATSMWEISAAQWAEEYQRTIATMAAAELEAKALEQAFKMQEKAIYSLIGALSALNRHQARVLGAGFGGASKLGFGTSGFSLEGVAQLNKDLNDFAQEAAHRGAVGGVSQRQATDATFASWMASGRISASQGAIIPATPGGRFVRVGEGGRDEAIIPLGSRMRGMGNTYILQIDASGGDPQKIAEVIFPALQALERDGLLVNLTA